MSRVALVVGLVVMLAVGVARLARRGRQWGSTPGERTMTLPGDTLLAGGPRARTVMTRAISIDAPPEVVWPWLAQLGRGAGWYSYDRLDNGGRASANHIVSWIPSPRVGDAAAIGVLREIEPGRALTWFLPGETTLGTTMRMTTDLRLATEGTGARLVIRISGDATGRAGALVLRGFEVVDSIMAIRQLKGIKARAEAHGCRSTDPATPETGERDQFQLYETIWSSGEGAGVGGREHAARWWREAVAGG